MNAIIIKPGDDKKAGENIQSRAKEELKADYIVPKDINIYDLISKYLVENNLDCILVDEAQFLTAKQVDELSDIVDIFNIPVICYGLRADAFTHLFTGCQRLFEVADAFEELKAVCKCGSKATHNIRFDKINDELINNLLVKEEANEEMILYTLICDLEPIYKDIILLYYYDNMKTNEIAKW